MVERPVFIPLETGPFVRTIQIEFKWHPGFAVSQKQKSIGSLHESAARRGINNALEISTKSPSEIGRALSAFNLGFTTITRQLTFSVECAFQAGKVFENGGPYLDLLDMPSNEAKRDPRLRNSGRLVEFHLFGEHWPLTPRTAFYDWLYINALKKKVDLASEVLRYQAFTDIEFNPEKSINCQAYSAALFCSLSRRSMLPEGAISKNEFLSLISRQE
jgi:hypothetical protein